MQAVRQSVERPLGHARQLVQRCRAMSIKWAVFRLMKRGDDGENVSQSLQEIQNEHLQDPHCPLPTRATKYATGCSTSCSQRTPSPFAFSLRRYLLETSASVTGCEFRALTFEVFLFCLAVVHEVARSLSN